MDLYDAREPHVPGEQVGFPPESSTPECASSEECRPSSSSSPPPSLGSPLSTTLSGIGNLEPPPPSPLPASKPPSLTRAQKLTKALKACQKQKSKKKRVSCEKHARKWYGAKAKTKSAKAGKASVDKTRVGG